MNHPVIDRPGDKTPPHKPLTEFYSDPQRRAGFVRELFDRTARDYNLISGILSLGTDRRYRRSALRRAGLRPGLKVLDVATGTGLVARAALDLGVAPSDLIGLDPSWGMLVENRCKTGLQLVQAFGEALPFGQRAFDFILMGYALRHVEDLGVLFRDFRRVLKPGGRVLILEITRPGSRLGYGLTKLYFQRIVPLFSRCLTRNREAGKLMEYYWATIAECVPPEKILAALADAGFESERRLCGPLFSEYLAV